MIITMSELIIINKIIIISRNFVDTYKCSNIIKLINDIKNSEFLNLIKKIVIKNDNFYYT